MCTSKDQFFHKGVIFMVPRLNLGGNSIYTLCHGSPYTKAYFSQGEPKLVASTCVHSGYSASEVEVSRQCVPFPNPIKSFFNMVLHTLSLGSLSLYHGWR